MKLRDSKYKARRSLSIYIYLSLYSKQYERTFYIYLRSSEDPAQESVHAV